MLFLDYSVEATQGVILALWVKSKTVLTAFFKSADCFALSNIVKLRLIEALQLTFVILVKLILEVCQLSTNCGRHTMLAASRSRTWSAVGGISAGREISASKYVGHRTVISGKFGLISAVGDRT